MVIEFELRQLALTWFDFTGGDYRTGSDAAPDGGKPRWRP